MENKTKSSDVKLTKSEQRARGEAHSGFPHIWNGTRGYNSNGF